MSFGGLILTNAGRNKMAAAISEKNALKFTHIQLGDGTFSGSYSSKTELSHMVMEIPVTRVQRNDNEVLIECDWNSKQAPTAFYLREIGIIGNGVLCYYDNARSEDAEYIDPESEAIVKQKRFRFTISVTDDVEITTMISSGLYALAEEVEQSLSKLNENKLDKTGDAKDTTVTFEDTDARTNISSGDKLSTILSKIKKFFTDLKAVAFTGSYTDLSNKPTSLPADGGTAAYLNAHLIPANADLNATDYRTPGFYYCPSNATVATFSNCPTTNAFFMIVGKHAGVYQEITEYTTSNPKKYMRNFYNNTWSSWYRVYTEADKPTASEVGALASNGNAVSATKATKDGDGNTISSTYLKRSGGTMTGNIEVTSSAYMQSNIRTKSIKSTSTNQELSMPYTNQLLFKDTTYASNLGFTFMTYNDTFGYFQPHADLKNHFGSGGLRWLDVYAQNGSIQTSDRREKCDISYIGQNSEIDTAMTDEQLEALIMGILPVVYKRINGQSGRPHHGLIAQDFEELLKEIGVSDHAGLIKSPLTEEIEEEVIVKDKSGKIVYDDEGNPQKNKIVVQKEIEGEYRYGFRYEELVTDIIRFLQILNYRYQSLKDEYESLKERVEALENK